MAAAMAIAHVVDIVDDVGRAYANWTWILDLAGRLEEAVEVSLPMRAGVVFLAALQRNHVINYVTLGSP
jgi:hypothetical protein